MKKNPRRWALYRLACKKTCIVMRLLVLLLVTGVLQSFALDSYSQKAKLTVNLRDVSIEKVLLKIEQQSDFTFVYNKQTVNLEKKVDANFVNQRVSDILDVLLEREDIDYHVFDKQVVLTAKGFATSQENHIVTGMVVDQKGIPLPGVSIVIKGTTSGVTTDIDGKYSLEVPKNNAVLVFSFVGMKTMELSFGDKSLINVTLQEDTTGLDEVVVVGYGVQKKVNLTGAVQTIGDEKLQNRPVANVSQALTGQMAGVTIIQRSGEPGSDGGAIRIRGEGTFSGAGVEPLVLVDGLPSTMSDVDPNDIENISVLKDAASASIYGSRAANGVILITTKKGKEGKTKVSYNGYVGWQQATEFPDYLDSWEYAKLYNEALANDGQQALYTPEEIQKFKDGSDPDNYPNTDFLNEVFSGSGFQTGHNVSVKGGTKANQYALSLGYLNQDGLVDKNSFERYNMRLNLNSQVSKKIDIALKLSMSQASAKEPVPAGGSGLEYEVTSIIQQAVRLSPTIAGRKSDGTYGFMNEAVPLGWMDSESNKNNKTSRVLGSLNMGWNITDDLRFDAMAGYKFYYLNRSIYGAFLQIDENTSQGPAEVINYLNDNSTVTLQALLNYNKQIGEHKIQALAGYSQEEFRSDWTKASRDDFPNNELTEISAGSENNMKASGSASEWALQSVFGRVNYSYLQRYLLEANVRYDGSSRFSKGNRFGVYPSVSVGWRISEEDFLKNNFSWVDNLKLRTSWGQLGNQNIGAYPYQFAINLGENYSWGGSLVSGAAVNTLPTRNISWETTEMTDAGIDMNLFNGKLNVIVDYFNKKTKDILYKVSTSGVLGLTPSDQNAGEVQNKGWEFAVSHSNKLGDFSYNVGVNFSVIDNKVLKLANLDKDIANGLFVGQPMNCYYGYVADGLYVDDEDVANSPTQFFTAQPGDIKYRDISGPDGVPDGKVDATYDRTVIGSRIPKYTFGTSLSGEYKNFDFSVQLQGVSGVDGQMNEYAGAAFYHKGKAQKWHLDRWTEENPNPNASHPRVQILSNTGEPNLATSTFWAINASYLRVKNLQLGYTLPKGAIDKIGVSKMRVYFSGQNLFTFDNYYKGWDPELVGGSSFYPLTAVYTFGVNASF